MDELGGIGVVGQYSPHFGGKVADQHGPDKAAVAGNVDFGVLVHVNY